jgi:hypothetical protein
MWKKLIALAAASVLLGSTIRPADAFWHWHHRHCCQTAAPVYYYAAPQAAPQEAPNKLVEAFLPIVADLIRSKLGTVITTPPTTQPSSQTDLTGIKSDIAQIAASLENTNSTLRRHGEEIVNLRLDLAAMKGDVETIKGLVGSAGTLQKQVSEIVSKLPLKTKTDLLTNLSGADFTGKISGHPTLSEDEEKALIKVLTDEMKKVLDAHYGQ